MSEVSRNRPLALMRKKSGELVARMKGKTMPPAPLQPLLPVCVRKGILPRHSYALGQPNLPSRVPHRRHRHPRTSKALNLPLRTRQSKYPSLIVFSRHATGSTPSFRWPKCHYFYVEHHVLLYTYSATPCLCCSFTETDCHKTIRYLIVRCLEKPS